MISTPKGRASLFIMKFNQKRRKVSMAAGAHPLLSSQAGSRREEEENIAGYRSVRTGRSQSGDTASEEGATVDCFPELASEEGARLP